MTDPTYANLLGQAAGGIPFTDPDTGKEYEVSFLTPRKMASFEKWMFATAVKSVMSAKDLLPPDDYQELLDRATTRPYKFFSAHALRVLSDLPGVLALHAILFGVSEGEMQDLWARWGPEVGAVVNYVLAMSRPRAWRGPGQGEGPEG